MPSRDAILAKWFARSVEAFSKETAGFLATEKDRFRNPVGHTLRGNLAVLLRELLGEMDTSRAKPALEAIVRVQALQDLSGAKGEGFVSLLRPIVSESMPEADAELLNRRLDELARLASEEYLRCRARIAQIRENELRRALAVPSALSRARS